VDEHWGNRQGGLLWELGNELWGDWQIGYPTFGQIAARSLANSRAVRAVDPHARLIATGADEDHFHDWNAQQLTNPPETFNYLSTHCSGAEAQGCVKQWDEQDNAVKRRKQSAHATLHALPRSRVEDYSFHSLLDLKTAAQTLHPTQQFALTQNAGLRRPRTNVTLTAAKNLLSSERAEKQILR
jgi:hypothetical protein